MRIDYNEIFRHSYWICFISNSSTVRLWIIDGQLVGISSVASVRLPFIFGLLPVHLSVFRVYQICPHRIQMAEYFKWLLSSVQIINFYSIHLNLIIFASMWIVNKSIFTLNQVATLFHTNTHTHCTMLFRAWLSFRFVTHWGIHTKIHASLFRIESYEFQQQNKILCGKEELWIIFFLFGLMNLNSITNYWWLLLERKKEDS